MTLVVSPAALRDVWISNHPDDPGEAQKWRPDLVESGQLVWTSYHSLRGKRRNKNGNWVPDASLDPELHHRWDTVIFDESHNLKERKTTWTVAAKMLRSDRTFLATGTALPNWGHEIFTALQFVFPEEAHRGKQYGSYWRWVEQWFQTRPDPHGNAHSRIVGDLYPGYTWEDFARGNGMGGRWLRRAQEEVLGELPPVTVQTIRVPMGTEQRRAYGELRRAAYALIPETGHEVVAWSAGGVYPKLLRLSTGIEVEDPNYTKYGSKLTVVRELMANRTHPTLIFCHFRATAEVCANMLRKDGFRVGVISGAYTDTQRRQAVADFRQGRYDVLVGTLATMSEGFTLTRADTAIFIERDPRPSKNLQAIRRIQRFGQDRPCLRIDLITPGTVDEVMLQLLADKSDQQAAAITGFDLAQAERAL
jgi:SNF2 family DNA or RNA helicase